MRGLPAPWHSLVPIALVVALTAAVYAPSLTGPFVYDDERFVVQNISVRQISLWPSYFTDYQTLAASGGFVARSNSLLATPHSRSTLSQRTPCNMTQYTNHTDVEKPEMLRIDGIIEPAKDVCPAKAFHPGEGMRALHDPLANI